MKCACQMWGIHKFNWWEGLSPGSCQELLFKCKLCISKQCSNNNTLFWLKKGLGSVHISSKIKLMMMLQIPLHDIQIFVCSLWGSDTENHWLPGRKAQPSPHHSLLSGHSAALVWEIYQSTKLPLGQAPHPSCHPYFFSLTFSHVCYIPDPLVASFNGEDFYFLYNLTWNSLLGLKGFCGSFQLSCLKSLCFLKTRWEKKKQEKIMDLNSK